MANNPDIEVRQAVADDRDALEVFYRQAYGDLRGALKSAARWNWLNHNNPFIKDRYIPIWVAVCNGRIIGHSGAMEVSCKIGDETRRAAWDIDTFVLAEYRGRGIGTRLQKANRDGHEVFMCLYMSDANRAIKTKLGSSGGPLVTLYVHVKSLSAEPIGDFFRGLTRRRNAFTRACVTIAGRVGLFAAMAACFGAILRQRRGRSVCAIEANLEFHPARGRFGSKADELWSAIRTDYNVAIERNSEYLNWKFVDQPDLHYQKYYAIRAGKIVGIVIFRLSQKVETPFGVIAEVICRKSDTSCAASLMVFADKKLFQQGAGGVYCATGLDEHSTVLEDIGFVPLWHTRMMWHDNRGQIATLKQPYAPLIGKGDMDWDHDHSLSQPSLLKIMQLACSPKTGPS